MAGNALRCYSRKDHFRTGTIDLETNGARSREKRGRVIQVPLLARSETNLPR